ncbi:MAG: hypothetical protein ACE5H2_08515 [Terriglobia bacterium]
MSPLPTRIAEPDEAGETGGAPTSGAGGGGGGTAAGSPTPLPAPGQTEKTELLQAALGQPVPLAYGRHIVGGNVVFMHKNAPETSGETSTLFLALGEGEWDGPEVVWVNGVAIALTATSLFHFHPGTEGELDGESDPATPNQKICSFYPPTFTPQLTFSRTAYAAFKLKPDPTAPGPAYDIRGVYRTMKVRQFDSAGNQLAYSYSANPAWCILDLLIRRAYAPHQLAGETLTAAVKARINFAAFKTAADECDFDIGGGTKRFEAHVAFVDPTDLARALEQMLLLCRGYLIENAGKIALFIDQDRSSVASFTRDAIAAGSLQFAHKDLRSLANHYLLHFRALDSGGGDAKKDFQPQLKQFTDEDHQDQVGRIITAKIDFGNQTPERTERLGEYLRRRTLNLTRHLRARLLSGAADAIDLLPGDIATFPDDLDAASSATRNYEILEITDEPDGAREVFAQEFDSSIFVDTAGPQQAAAPPAPEPAPGPVVQHEENWLVNSSFFIAGVAGQEGTDLPKYHQRYSNAGGTPGSAEVEYLAAEDWLKLKTSTSTVDKIGFRTLWKNLGRLFKPAEYLTITFSLRHTGGSGTYDKAVRVKLDSEAEDYTDDNENKLELVIPANSIPSSLVLRFGTTKLKSTAQVPDALNLFLWSEATAAAQANFDLEVDWVALARGRRPSKWVPLLVPDSEITWDSGPGLYALPAWLVKGSVPSLDSGGAGASSGIGSGGADREEGTLQIL